MTTTDQDLVLLDRWCAGDAASGHALFARHFSEIYRFFAHKVGVEADDLTQRTFLACVSARGQFRAQSSFRTYLFAIARNELYAHLKRTPAGERVDFEQISLAEIETTPSVRLDRARQAETLRGELAKLPAEQQLLLELHYWHDLDAAALAEVFAATPGAIRVRLLRARQTLKARLRDAGLADAPARLARELTRDPCGS